MTLSQRLQDGLIGKDIDIAGREHIYPTMDNGVMQQWYDKGTNDTKGLQRKSIPQAVATIAADLKGMLPKRIEYTGDQLMGMRIAVSEEKLANGFDLRDPKELDAYNKAIDEMLAVLDRYCEVGE